MLIARLISGHATLVSALPESPETLRGLIKVLIPLTVKLCLESSGNFSWKFKSECT